jgi:hypothetical protein
MENGQMRADSVSERIRWLTSHHLRKIGVSKYSGAWETLFQDPDDGRFWELTYPQSEMQGGGSPALSLLTRDEATAKYEDLVP